MYALSIASSSAPLKPPLLLRSSLFKKNLNLATSIISYSSSIRSKHRESPSFVSLQVRRRKKRSWGCRAEFSQDAPFAVAIGACVLNSLVFPVPGGPDDDADSAIDSTDAMFAVMGIISLIPYFNWLSWVFAWLDSGSRRYVVYAIVYLAPYLRTNLSLSPEESWLPIASIIFCIIHIQLEASIRNGDIQGFQLFNEASKFSPLSRKNDNHFEGHQGNTTKGSKSRNQQLPSAHEQSRNELQGWQVSEKQSHEHLTEDGDGDGDVSEGRKD